MVIVRPNEPTEAMPIKSHLRSNATGMVLNFPLERPGAQSPDSSRTVLCIDDDELGLQVRKAVLQSVGFTVLTANDGPTGINAAETHAIDVVVLDYKMPGMDGEEVATVLKREHPNLPIILFTGSYLSELPRKLLRLADAYLQKGDCRTSLLSLLRSHFGNEARPCAEGNAE